MMQRFFTLSLLLTLFSASVMAQWHDDFSDGDFLLNPQWTGDQSHFMINSSGQLQLNTSQSDTSILVVQSSKIRATEWSFWVKLTFNTSSNNLARVYLASNQSDLGFLVQGYHIEIGNTSDNVCLYRQDGSSRQLLISGVHASTANTSNQFEVKASCDSLGNWQLFTNSGAGYVLEGSANDTVYTQSNYFGVFCKYTISNSTRFYFDNFNVKTSEKDTLAPKLVSHQALNSHQVFLQFDEVLAASQTLNPLNYFADGGLGNPDSVRFASQDSSALTLYFSGTFVQAQPYHLLLSKVTDLLSNTMGDTSITLMYYELQYGDVVINEIMADPTPLVGLPDAEYIELFNRAPIDINLQDFTLTIGESIKILPDYILPAGGYLLLCNSSNEATLQPYGSVLPLSSFSLLNSGAPLLLLDPQQQLMHYVEYDLSLYGNAVKADGGWSLELRDASKFCLSANNWSASTDVRGGSPGAINSIAQLLSSTNKLQIHHIQVLSPLLIQVFFNQELDKTAAENLQNYSFDQGMGQPIYVDLLEPGRKAISMQLAQVLQAGKVYQLTVAGAMANCAGQSVGSAIFASFGLPQAPDSADILLSEILFDPLDPNTDYVELYNVSSKIIDLSQVQLGNLSSDGVFENNVGLNMDGLQFLPKTYYVFTTTPEALASQYYIENPSQVIRMKSLPTMSNTEGNIYVLSSNLQALDGMEYSEDMHFALLSNTEGVSLERIDLSKSALEKSNWHSAAVPGRNFSGLGGTPTYLNSQSVGSITSNSQWSLEPEIFSPDNDGYQDLVRLSYKMESEGFVANINIYDAQGRPVKQLANQLMLPTEGYLVWDGVNEDGQKAPIGIYIVYIECFNLDGKVEKQKLNLVVGAKF